MILRRTTLVALLLAAAACGGGSDDDEKPDAGKEKDSGAVDSSTPVDSTVVADTSAPPMPDQVTNAGEGCTSKANCTGMNPTCTTSISIVVQSITFPAGYCSATCKTNLECGSSGECPIGVSLSTAPSFPGLDLSTFIPSNCYKRCTTDSDCRTGEKYRCTTILDALSSGAGGGLNLGGINIGSLLSGPIKDNQYCLPPAPPAPDGGTDSGTPAHDGGAADTGAADTGAADAGSDAASTDAGSDAGTDAQ
jgi:hypothetical protein